MKRSGAKTFTVGLLLLAALLLAACNNQETVQSLTEQRNQFEEQVRQLTQRNNTLQEDRDSLQAEIDSLQTQLTALTEMNSSLKGENEDLRTKLEGNFEAQLQLVEDQLEKARMGLQALEVQRSNLIARMEQGIPGSESGVETAIGSGTDTSAQDATTPDEETENAQKSLGETVPLELPTESQGTEEQPSTPAASTDSEITSSPEETTTQNDVMPEAGGSEVATEGVATDSVDSPETDTSETSISEGEKPATATETVNPEPLGGSEVKPAPSEEMPPEAPVTPPGGTEGVPEPGNAPQ